MKKQLFFLAAGALALSACTSEEVMDDVTSSRNAIKFETVVNKPTRAADLTTSNLTNFNVFGFYTMPENPNVAHAVFKDVLVSKSGGTWSYAEEDTRFWIPGAKYYFYAYSCGNVATKDEQKFGKFAVDMESGEKPASQRVLEIDNYLCDNTHQHDLIFASKLEYEALASNDPVAFSFKHVLTKLQARFTNTFSGEYDVVVKQVTVDDIRNKGDYNFSTSWQDVVRKDSEQPFVYLLDAKREGAVNEPITIQSKNNAIADPNKLLGESESAYVIPFDYTSQSEEKVYLNITIDVKYGDDIVIKGKQLKATLNPNWQEGYTYIYNIDLNASTINLGKIEFTVDKIEGWNDGGEHNTPLDK